MNASANTFADKVVVVTGGGSGLGRHLVLELSRRRARVAACDVDEAGLAETASLADGDVFTARVDVSQRSEVQAFAETVRERFGVVHQLYSNAGIAFVGPVEKTGYDDFERVMATDFWGVVYATKEFLPYLLASGDGHVVAVSSVFGLVAAPWMSSYDAAKFGVRGFIEALRGELIAQRQPVRVTCVHPGAMRTPIANNAAADPDENMPKIRHWFDRLALTPPDRAARQILRGVERRRARVLIGPDARVADIGQRIGGAAYERVAAAIARRFLPT